MNRILEDNRRISDGTGNPTAQDGIGCRSADPRVATDRRVRSISLHGTQGRIAKIFSDAREHAPSTLFFDEIDAMVPSRSGDSVGHHYASEVNEFPVRLNECGRQRILVVGATNLPSRLDPAVWRPGRLDKKFFVAPPDYEARHELLRLYMRDRPQEELDWHSCATESETSCAQPNAIHQRTPAR